jgi:hypothetical protein
MEDTMSKGRTVIEITGGWWGLTTQPTLPTGPGTVARLGVGINLNSSGKAMWMQEQIRMLDLTYTRGIGTYGS